VANVQHRKAAVLLAAIGCASLLAMYVVEPKKSRDHDSGQQTMPMGGVKLTTSPRVQLAHVTRPADDRLEMPPFTIPEHNFTSINGQGTNVWSEGVAVASGLTLVRLVAKGWGETSGWVQPVAEDSTYVTDQTGRHYRVLSDFGHYNDNCVSQMVQVPCRKMLPGEVYRFELAFEGLGHAAMEVKLNYTGASAPADIAVLPWPLGEWTAHPVEVTAVPLVTPLPASVAVQPAALPRPSPPPPPVIAAIPPPACGTVQLRSLNLTDRFDAPGLSLVKLDWATARLYLRAGASTPVYPQAACGQRVQGAAILDLLVGADGTVRRIEPVHGDGMFVDEAERAMRDWRFNPVQSHGRQALLATRIELDFTYLK
jgi:TonB family protein